MADDQIDYFRRRLAEEDAIARSHDDHRAAAIHRQLALAYRERIEALAVIGQAGSGSALL